MARKKRRRLREAPAPVTESERRKHRMRQRERGSAAAPPPGSRVVVRRRPTDDDRAALDFNRLGSVRWSREFGGRGGTSEQLFIMATVRCTDVHDLRGSIHAGSHGPCPHNIRVVILREDNAPATWDRLEGAAG